MNTLWRIQLLGGLRVEGHDRVVSRFRTQKTAALLAYLALHRDRSHPREALLAMLWPEDELDAARNKLRLALSSLRRQLEPPGVPGGGVIAADRLGVRLNPDAVATDVAAFEAARTSAARAGSPLERALLLTQAAELYRGELLPGFYEEWIGTHRGYLAEANLQVLRDLVTHLEQSRDLTSALEYARRAVSVDPLREEAHRDLMRVLANAGRPADALQQYLELERILREELGEAPSPASQELAEEIQSSGTAVGAQVFMPSGDQEEPDPTLQRLNTRTPEHREAPFGTVTFLLTDIEGSTALWERAGEAFRMALGMHHALLRREFRRHGGYEIKEAGDSFLVAFPGVRSALACAVAGQQRLAAQPWPPAVGMLRVRIALHTGDVELDEESYHDLVLHHAARMLVAAHGGQILCSEVTAGLLRQGQVARGGASARAGATAPEIPLLDLGTYRLRDMATSERLFQAQYSGMAPDTFPPLKAERGYAANLPTQFTRFFGHEQELAQLEALLAPSDKGIQDRSVGSDRSVRPEHLNTATRSAGARPEHLPVRLVTLTGPGGSGKTRLALEAAERLVAPFRGAVWFVPLADLGDASEIMDAIQLALRLPRSPDVAPSAQVTEALARQPSLLVLDNCEHLVAEGALLIRALLEQAPALKCLVTSRQRLELEGERELEVLPLATPHAMDVPERLTLYESVQLFVDRAQAALPDFQVTNASAAAVAELCHRLEGIPLALELAAARVKVLTLAQMLAHLEHRLDFLVSRRRDGAARHRTLRAAIDWSYQLLPPELQRLFARLSVFRGPWTLKAAAAVLTLEGEREDDLLEGVTALVDQSLLRRVAGEGGEARFTMLETLREYAQERLELSNDAAALRQRLASHFHVTGGTLRADALSYVTREADTTLHEALIRGEYCWVLTSRQMGKSSLMLRSRVRLREEGVQVALLDLTALSRNLTPEQWYGGLLKYLVRQLDPAGDLEIALDDFWLSQARLDPPQRWLAALREVVLPRLDHRPPTTDHRPTPASDNGGRSSVVGGRLVLFIDEIDAIRSLSFSTDAFFAAIRECYAPLAADPELERLTFCVLGVATPEDLVREPGTAPFESWHRITLDDFTEAEAAHLADGFDLPAPVAGALLRRVLYWTGGHPYLTQRLCRAVAEANAANPKSKIQNLKSIDRLCEEQFLSPRARERDDNLVFVRARLLHSGADLAALLDLYVRVWRGQKPLADKSNPLVDILLLAGIVRDVEGQLWLRNRIYERVFDEEWARLQGYGPPRSERPGGES